MTLSKKRIFSCAVALSVLFSCGASASISHDAYDAAMYSLSGKNTLTMPEVIKLLNYSADHGLSKANKQLFEIYSDPESEHYSISKARKNLYMLGLNDSMMAIDYAYNKFNDKGSVLYSEKYRDELVKEGADKGILKYALLMIEGALENESSESSDIINRYYPLLADAQSKSPHSRKLSLLRFNIVNAGFVADSIDKFSIIEPLAMKGDRLAISYTISNTLRTEIPSFSTCTKLLGYIKYQQRFNKVDDNSVIWKMAYTQCNQYTDTGIMNAANQFANKIYANNEANRKRVRRLATKSIK